MRQAVFLSTGIGNALLMIPLVKALRERGTVSAICTSIYRPEEVFEGFTDPLFDQFIHVRDFKRYVHRAVLGRHIFDKVYIDHFSTTRKQSLLALRMGKEVYAINRHDGLPASLINEKVSLVAPKEGIHEAAQCMRLLNPDFNANSLQATHFSMSAIPASPAGINWPYITLQPGAGSGRSPWKTLPIATWQAVLQQLLELYSDHHFVLLGDASDQALIHALSNHERVHEAIDKYALKELPSVMAGASLHLGGDSALMHLAACLGVPSVTVWGGSDPVMYGWQSIDAHKHVVIHKEMPCGPCSRWLNPNTSRVNDPAACPDFACIRSIPAERIVNASLKLLGR